MHRYEVIYDLIKENNAEIIAEIGVHKGKTLKYILKSDYADNIKEYWAIDSWEYFNKKKDRLYGNGHFYICRLMTYFPQLKVLKLTSKDASLLFDRFVGKGYFDLVFIDADHSYEAVKEDIVLWESLVKPNGVLCGHDYGIDRDYGKDEKPRHPGVAKAVDEIFGCEVSVLDCGVWVV